MKPRLTVGQLLERMRDALQLEILGPTVGHERESEVASRRRVDKAYLGFHTGHTADLSARGTVGVFGEAFEKPLAVRTATRGEIDAREVDRPDHIGAGEAAAIEQAQAGE